jgi:hypothetical protein
LPPSAPGPRSDSPPPAGSRDGESLELRSQLRDLTPSFESPFVSTNRPIQPRSSTSR